MESANTGSMAAVWKAQGAAPEDLVRAFRSFNAGAEPFRRESENHEQR
jgi:hypothetical protein